MDKDLQNCAIYIINGIIVDYFEGQIIPTVETIKANWQYTRLSGKNLIDYNMIQSIINKVAKYYN